MVFHVEMFGEICECLEDPLYKSVSSAGYPFLMVSILQWHRMNQLDARECDPVVLFSVKTWKFIVHRASDQIFVSNNAWCS